MVAEEDAFEWNFENTTELITLYEKFPCLYDVRSKDYKNQDARDKAVARYRRVMYGKRFSGGIVLLMLVSWPLITGATCTNRRSSSKDVTSMRRKFL